MSEIKFRAWDKEQKKWIEEEELRSWAINALFDPPSYITFVQYTGLKDKNIKEIYEGDIHKLADGITAFVVWDNDCAAFQSQRIEYVPNTTDRSSHLFGIELSEVIGNIYENPELLNS